MIPEFRTILYCTQIGPNSPFIFRQALGLARGLNAKIHVLHVMETLPPRQEAMVEKYIGPDKLHALEDQVEHDADERLKKRLEVFCEREGEEDCRRFIASVTIARGHRADQILAHTRELGADLVVMGAHHKSPFMDALLGTTADEVVKKSSLPVVLVQVPRDKQEPGLSTI